MDGRWSVSGNSIVEPDEQGHLSNKVLCLLWWSACQKMPCTSLSLQATREVNACDAPGVSDMQHYISCQLMYTRPPVLTALHSTHMHLTSLQAVAHMQPQSACTDVQPRVVAMQVVVQAPPAFHLFYGEPGWQGASIHMRLTCKQHTQVCPLHSA